MQTEAQYAEAQCVIGIQFTEKSHVCGHHAIEFFAIGTAVARYKGRAPVLRPRMVLNLDD